MGEESSMKKFIVPLALSSIGCMPLIIGLFVVFVGVFLVLGLFDGGSGGGTVCVNMKPVSSICQSITVDGETMSVDEYVAGVVGGEVGVFSGHPEIQKALSIAARTYSLNGATKDGNGNCSVPNGEHFQVYNSSQVTDSIKKIVEETSGMVLVNEEGNIQSTEYDSVLLVEAYDSSGTEVTFKQRDLKVPKDWLIEVREPDISCSINSMNTYDDDYDGYGCGHGRGMSQWGGLYLEMEKGYDYIEILDYFYGKDSGYNLTLASTHGASSKCTSSNNGNFLPLASYNLEHNGLQKLNKKLSSNELTDLEIFIDKGVEKAGYGTGEAVAAAGQNLAYGLEQLGYYLGYYWGGGHRGENGKGVIPSWGENVGIAYTDSGKPTGPEYGMDCSGFVSWSIRQACDPNYGSTVAVTFTGYGDEISINDAKPGDLAANSGHVILILKNNGDGTVTTVESTLGGGGLVFRVYSSLDGYKIVDMKNWYSNNCTTQPS